MHLDNYEIQKIGTNINVLYGAVDCRITYRRRKTTVNSVLFQDLNCSVLQCVAVCCSVLQCVAVCCSVLQGVAVCCCVLQCVVVCCSVLQCVAVCCSVLQCVAGCCSVLQCVAVCTRISTRFSELEDHQFAQDYQKPQFWMTVWGPWRFCGRTYPS